MKKEKLFGTRPVISNIVASGRLPNEIDIVSIYKKVDFPHKQYEPETYPALLVKVNIEGKLKHVTLYKNGKYIIAGANSEKELNQIYDEIIRILKKHKYIK
jgi:TATA-box binding protein (TBP) (component of TFIID and TFIIIB)